MQYLYAVAAVLQPPFAPALVTGEPLIPGLPSLALSSNLVAAATVLEFAAFLTLLLVGFALPLLSAPGRRHLVTFFDTDVLRPHGGRSLNPWLTLGVATFVGAAIALGWRLRGSLGPAVGAIYIKEGPLELLTFVLDLLAGCLCLRAAWRWKSADAGQPPHGRRLVGVLGLLLVVVAMEEIGWGQTLLGFATPSAWQAINHQGETTLHNLLDRDLLTLGWMTVSVLFAVALLVLTGWSWFRPRSWLSTISPHPSLLPLGLLAAYSGVRLHPEIVEALLALFFTGYALRLALAMSGPNGRHLHRAKERRVRYVPEPPRSVSDRGRGRWRIILRAGLAAGLVAALVARADAREMAAALPRISPAFLLGALGCLLVGLVISAWRWGRALAMHQLSFPFRFLLRVVAVGFFFNNFLPTMVGGDAYRAYRTLPASGRRSRPVSALAVDRGVGFIVLLAMGAIGAVEWIDRAPIAQPLAILYLIGTGAGAFGMCALQFGWFRQIARKPGSRPLQAISANLDLLHHRGRDWLALLAASLAFQLISVGIIYALFRSLGADIDFWACAIIATTAGLAAVLPLSINGIGVVEGALVGTSVALGLDYETAFVVAVARRLLAAALAVVCGVVYATHWGEIAAPQEARPPGWRRFFARLTRPIPTPPPPPVDPPARAPATGESLTVPVEFLEHTHDAFIVWELNGDGILYWNRAAEQLYGYRRQEALGRATHDLLQTRVAGGVTLLEEHLARFGVWLGELRHTCRDGRVIVVEARLALMSQSSGRWLVLETNRDVTDRRAAESAARDREQQVSALHVIRSRDD